MHYLYRKDNRTPIMYPDETPFLKACELKVFRPKVVRLAATYETLGLKAKLSRLQFVLATRGRVQVYHLCDGDHLVHTAYLVPHCSKFRFMSIGDHEIGPCVTETAYRGKGAYRYMLSNILKSHSTHDGSMYMIVSDTNSASIRGIESVGFIRVGTVKPAGLFKNYRLETYDDGKSEGVALL